MLLTSLEPDNGCHRSKDKHQNPFYGLHVSQGLNKKSHYDKERDLLEGADLTQLWELMEQSMLANASASSSQPEVTIDQPDW